MERISTVAEQIAAENAPTRTSSANQPISTQIGATKPPEQTISKLEHATLWAVINQSRLANGWTTKTAEDLDATIKTWHKVFRFYEIPTKDAKLLDKLYFRALGLRQNCLQNGKEPPAMNAELMAACWTGANGLKAELEQKRIEEKRYLPDTAASACPRCFGLGFEYVYSDDGKNLGCRPGCKHEPLKEGEWLWKKQQEEEETEF